MRGRMICGPFYIFAFMWWLVRHLSENHPSLLLRESFYMVLIFEGVIICMVLLLEAIQIK